MTIILILLASLIGIYIGKEWTAIKYDRKLLDAEKDATFWKDVAVRQKLVIKKQHNEGKIND